MNWDQIEGKWDQLRGQIKAKWGKLTDRDLTVAEGKRDVLVGKIQERYGCLKDEAERQIDEWLGALGVASTGKDDAKRERHDSVL